MNLAYKAYQSFSLTKVMCPVKSEGLLTLERWFISLVNFESFWSHTKNAVFWPILLNREDFRFVAQTRCLMQKN